MSGQCVWPLDWRSFIVLQNLQLYKAVSNSLRFVDFTRPDLIFRASELQTLKLEKTKKIRLLSHALTKASRFLSFNNLTNSQIKRRFIHSDDSSSHCLHCLKRSPSFGLAEQFKRKLNNQSKGREKIHEALKDRTSVRNFPLERRYKK